MWVSLGSRTTAFRIVKPHEILIIFILAEAAREANHEHLGDGLETVHELPTAYLQALMLSQTVGTSSSRCPSMPGM